MPIPPTLSSKDEYIAFGSLFSLPRNLIIHKI